MIKECRGFADLFEREVIGGMKGPGTIMLFFVSWLFALACSQETNLLSSDSKDKGETESPETQEAPEAPTEEEDDSVADQPVWVNSTKLTCNLESYEIGANELIAKCLLTKKDETPVTESVTWTVAKDGGLPTPVVDIDGISDAATIRFIQAVSEIASITIHAEIAEEGAAEPTTSSLPLEQILPPQEKRAGFFACLKSNALAQCLEEAAISTEDPPVDGLVNDFEDPNEDGQQVDCTPDLPQGGSCWLLGEPSASCTDTCVAASLVYDEATLTYAGSAGSNANCNEILDLFGAQTGFAGGNQSVGIGCGLGTGLPLIGRSWVSSPATNADDVLPNFRRACACK